MADQSVSVSGPVTIESDSVHRVAFDLAMVVMRNERANGKAQQDREYWLTLYSQCLSAVHGGDVGRILGKK